MVASCVTTTRLTTVDFDPRVLAPCLGPVDVPNRELTKLELVQFYNTNRDRLIECKAKHGELRSQILRVEAVIKDGN